MAQPFSPPIHFLHPRRFTVSSRHLNVIPHPCISSERQPDNGLSHATPKRIEVRLWGLPTRRREQRYTCRNGPSRGKFGESLGKVALEPTSHPSPDSIMGPHDLCNPWLRFWQSVICEVEFPHAKFVWISLRPCIRFPSKEWVSSLKRPSRIISYAFVAIGIGIATGINNFCQE
jgi:hypothetical protein